MKSVSVPAVPAGFVGLYIRSEEQKALFRFAITDNLPGLLDILQYCIDSMTDGLANIVIIDPLLPGKYAEGSAVGAHYGIRKRTFQEKLDDIKTYTIKEG